MKLRKRVEEKKKLTKKRKVIIISISIVTILLVASFCTIKYREYRRKKQREELILEIKKSYSKYVTSKKDIFLYTKSLKKVGTIKKQIDFELEKIKKADFKYFKINDMDYYVYYQDVEKKDKLEANDEYPNYLLLNKNVITKKNIKLYDGDHLAITFNQSLDLPIQFIDDDRYYIQYFNKFFYLKKEDVKSLREIKNSEEEDASYISIINYPVLASKCNSEDCTSIENIEEQIHYLDTHEYYPITLKEYKNWLAGNIRLKKKAVLLITPNKTNEVESINIKHHNILNIVGDNDGVKFIDDNNKTTKESKLDQLSRYNIKLDTKLGDFEKMVLGEYVPITTKVNASNSSTNQRIPVLNYHFFYDGATEACNENICLDTKNFKEQLDYLKNNQYKTLTIEEYRAWMYGELELPSKSVLITIDDGAFGTGRHNGNKLIPILEEYQMHATLFLIAGWWDINNYRSPNLDIESHTYDMHNTGSCGKAQVICANHDELLSDLQKSISIIGSSKAFCFPFYTYDEKSINVVKEAGFKLSFVGGNRKSSRGDNKYKIPRYPIYKNTSMDQFIRMVS